ncbi:MAG: hypothetical protein ACPL0A_02980 [Candidatus Micrarchaeia archaeon]
MSDFEKAIGNIKPSLTKTDIGRIEKFKEMENIIYR